MDCSYSDALTLLTATTVAVRFTNVGNEQRDELADTTSELWWMFLVVSSISPWMIQRIFNSITTDGLRPSKKRFTTHEMINNIAGFLYHLFPQPCFVWVAMVNFPPFFLTLYQSIKRKEASKPAQMQRKVSDYKKKAMCEVPELESLITFSVIVYASASTLLGKNYILSGCGVITLAFPLIRCSVSSSIALNALPLGIFFLLENYLVIHELQSCHAIHVLSHYAIHKATNDLYVGYFEE